MLSVTGGNDSCPPANLLLCFERKTLLARELARLLGAREPQIVNGPEILDKYIGEAEKRVRGMKKVCRFFLLVSSANTLHRLSKLSFYLLNKNMLKSGMILPFI